MDRHRIHSKNHDGGSSPKAYGRDTSNSNRRGLTLSLICYYTCLHDYFGFFSSINIDNDVLQFSTICRMDVDDKIKVMVLTPETNVFPDSDGDRSRLMMSPVWP